MRSKRIVTTVLLSASAGWLFINPYGWVAELNGVKPHAFKRVVSTASEEEKGSPLSSFWQRLKERYNNSAPEWWDDFEKFYEEHRDFFEVNDGG
jgi:hypothetical protein